VRLVFAGTPEVAVPSLRALLDSPRHDVVAVLTRPDAPAGRGRRLGISAIKQLALEAELEVLSPRSPREPEFLARLAEIAPDCCPVVAYGALLPKAALDIPRYGWVNLHFSLLPAWRGAAPVQHTLLAGDDMTGATTFRLEEGMDTGPYYGMVTEPIAPGDTSGDLLMRLSESGARLLVTRDHVSVVISHSALMFSAASYLTAKGVPVVGSGEDGPEWITAKNMFSVFGALNTTKVSDTTGKFFKMVGVTSLGSIGYGISPISSENAEAYAASAKSQGLKVGYLNAKFPFGSTDVQPAALAMKSAKVDGFTATTDPNTAFAFITALRQAGANIKATVLAIGYGGDLAQAGPGAISAAQNVYFTLAYEPVEMQTPATKQFVSDLKAAGLSGDPTFAIYNTYTAIGLVVRALKAAGSTSSSALNSALSNIHDWNALGLLGSHKLDLNNRSSYTNGVDNCLWVTKLEGNTYKLVKGATPICGKLLPGVTVRTS